MATRKSSAKSEAMEFLEKITGGPLTFGKMIKSIRECDEVTLEAFARRLGVSRAHLCDIEKGRRTVSVERALQWARKLGYPEWQFVELALQEQIDHAGIKARVGLKTA
jgi:antitoxin HigA-1